MLYSDNDRKLITRVYCLFSDNLICIKAWGFYLFDEEFNDEQELRNRAGVICLASLFDSIHAEVEYVGKYRKDAEQAGLIHIPRYCDQALEFFESTKEIINKYTKAEQVFIVYLRNQWVHSFLSGRHADNTNIKYVEKGTLKTETISRDQYDELVRPLFKADTLDTTLKDLISRFTDRSSRYWLILGEIQANSSLIYKAMLEGNQFQFSTISA